MFVLQVIWCSVWELSILFRAGCCQNQYCKEVNSKFHYILAEVLQMIPLLKRSSWIPPGHDKWYSSVSWIVNRRGLLCLVNAAIGKQQLMYEHTLPTCFNSDLCVWFNNNILVSIIIYFCSNLIHCRMLWLLFFTSDGALPKKWRLSQLYDL